MSCDILADRAELAFSLGEITETPSPRFVYFKVSYILPLEFSFLVTSSDVNCNWAELKVCLP